ncbi:MAG: hypothetical protein QF560_02635 [SAR324 cluster bacterium]|jgi:LDH2 family malate/lactate/ureidoglycolate dehydrogenase|nr:hypothetical protein [SAR324 cluster bacterium]HJM07796.1 hypothetical protein [SAR324 cluster bacterium]HJO46293.1 hypothetical protein [SAR324 cluster bacterium]|tara:strand:- start:4805 stop:5056 length:252 start_codon:yes stop_codon:yes gene_type:complete
MIQTQNLNRTEIEELASKATAPCGSSGQEAGSLVKLVASVDAIENQPGARIPGSPRWDHQTHHETNGGDVDQTIIDKVQALAT